MDPLTRDPSSPSPVPPTVTNAFKEENSGGDGPCETIKMTTKEEKVLGIVLTKKDDDDIRRLKILINENDATTNVQNCAAAAEGSILTYVSQPIAAAPHSFSIRVDWPRAEPRRA